MKQPYIILFAATSQELATKVSVAIVGGYQPSGSAYALLGEDAMGRSLGAHYQPMLLSAPNLGDRGPG